MRPYLARIAVISILFLFSGAAAPIDGEWTALLDKDLSKWGMYLGYRHKIGYHGETPLDEAGKAIPPIGPLNNVANVFTITEEHGAPVLRISGEIYGCLFSRDSYENYRLKLKVKWGEKKWEPRTDKLRDTGIVYHSIGPHGADYWRAWMLGQEFQIMEGHIGDYWNIANVAIDIRAFLPEGKMNPVANVHQPFVAIGTGTGNDGFCLRSEDFESPRGEWTEIELICFQGKSLHVVNGHVVMVLRNSRYVDNGKVLPLTRGKIQLQSEAAEVYYKDVRIMTLTEMPEAYNAYFQ